MIIKEIVHTSWKSPKPRVVVLDSEGPWKDADEAFQPPQVDISLDQIHHIHKHDQEY
jgi:hypothetical protein